MGDCRDLVAVYVAVFNDNRKALRERKVTLRDRLHAAEWFATTGWGRAPVVVDLPEEPLQVGPGDMLRQFMASLPPDLRAAAGDYPDGQFEQQLEADIRQVDEQFAAIMPPRATPE